MEELVQSVIVLHFSATVFMTGVIWFVQIVHYPLFAKVPVDAYPAYERQHQRLTTFVVAPAMVIELLSGAWLAHFLSDFRNSLLFAASGAVLIVVWLSTFFIQVPCHQSLTEKFSQQVHRKLVLSNWVRTIGWTVRSIALAIFVFKL